MTQDVYGADGKPIAYSNSLKLEPLVRCRPVMTDQRVEQRNRDSLLGSSRKKKIEEKEAIACPASFFGLELYVSEVRVRIE